MNNIKPVIFLIPVIALISAGLLYISLLKKAADKKPFGRLIFTMTLLAFLLNFTWELLQMPLYRNSFYDVKHITFCALASVADTIMVLLLYFGFVYIFKNLFWIQQIKLQQSAMVILTGGTGASLSEIRHLSLGSWAYADPMPIIPVVNVGLSPVLQFMILPLIIYVLSSFCLKDRKPKKN
ncbi:MAG: hypothetical protein ABI760_09415 [Ferruginibacter sp.]